MNWKFAYFLAFVLENIKLFRLFVITIYIRKMSRIKFWMKSLDLIEKSAHIENSLLKNIKLLFIFLIDYYSWNLWRFLRNFLACILQFLALKNYVPNCIYAANINLLQWYLAQTSVWLHSCITWCVNWILNFLLFPKKVYKYFFRKTFLWRKT